MDLSGEAPQGDPYLPSIFCRQTRPATSEICPRRCNCKRDGARMGCQITTDRIYVRDNSPYMMVEGTNLGTNTLPYECTWTGSCSGGIPPKSLFSGTVGIRHRHPAGRGCPSNRIERLSIRASSAYSGPSPSLHGRRERISSSNGRCRHRQGGDWLLRGPRRRTHLPPWPSSFR